MTNQTIILSCALLAILVAYLPLGEAVTCAADPTDANCVDCTLTANANNADCLSTVADTTTVAATTTVSATTIVADSTTVADTTTVASSTDATTRRENVLNVFRLKFKP
ncbi:uncharacterized protein Dvir_GJ15355 [Drosophila virilis]|uniref:Uncharacterized protein n=1 Tax=Drosophila virilis TaxID=7244 RepID=B4LR41_DROVI|nr:uncharacterized protein Dvir_GJ15355 [Drosophila virilis]